MRVLFAGAGERGTVFLMKDLGRYRVHVLRADSRESTFALLDAVDAVVLGLSPGGAGVDSLTVCRAIRTRSDLPIVVLAERMEIGERILGIRAGADDYVCQPYRAGTLIARIEAVRRMRTRQLEPSRMLRVDDVTIDLRSRSVTVRGQAIELSRKEFHILALLAEEGGGVCARDTLFTHVWGGPQLATDDTLNVHVATLRTKLGRPHLIETVRGVGYRLALTASSLAG